jgi:hypothetical protein
MDLSSGSRDFALDARDISFSPDARLLSIICSDGSAWFYSVAHERWEYMRYHYGLTVFGRFSGDGHSFVSSDINGQVVVRGTPLDL